MKSKIIWLIIGAIIIIAAIIVGVRIGHKPAEEKEQVIKIGAILPLTGPAASFGQYVKEGIDLAIEEINAREDFAFSILYEDSKNQPKEAVSAYRKMVSTQKPPVIISALSSVASALNPLASETETIQVYVDVAKPGVADGKYTFRIYPEANGTAGVIAEFAAKELKAKRAAVIHIDDDYGMASLNVFKERFRSLGGDVIFTETYSMMQKDLRGIIAKLNAVKPIPEVIYLNGYGPAFVAAVKQLKEMGVTSQLMADVALGLPENLDLAGEAAEGVYFVDANLSSEFITKFTHRYGKEPSSDAAYAYDIINILYKIAKEMSEFTVDYIRKGMRELKDFPGTTGKITMRTNGDAELQFVVKQVRQGQPVVIEK